MIKLFEIKDILKASVLCGGDLMEQNIIGGGAADLMEDVLAAAAEEPRDVPPSRRASPETSTGETRMMLRRVDVELMGATGRPEIRGRRARTRRHDPREHRGHRTRGHHRIARVSRADDACRVPKL